MDNENVTFTHKSFCIPRLEKSIKKEYICENLKKLNIGNIISITEIPLYNNPEYKRIIIKVSWDMNADLSMEIENLLQKYGSIKLIHNMPLYWKLVSTNLKN